ncbi:esterase/lipase family protein [Mumia sp. Pv 4-285]|uniref:esterase/lipase family protein n=1 Tax=Mumia qirimensis TaxID=3234852 RepID=UPI00351CDCA0
MTWRRSLARLTSLVATTLAILALAGQGLSASAAPEPALETPTSTLASALTCPTTFTHPDREPVLLVHGTVSNAAESWGWGVAPALRDQGFDVCTVDLPDYSRPDIQVSAEYVVHAIDAIYQSTGRKVDVVGHSQGNLQLRWAVKWWPHLQARVDDMVNLANPANGIVGGSAFCIVPCIPAATQFSLGSRFLDALNAGDPTPGPISYTSIYSLTDEAILPFTTAIVDGAKNISVQSVCPGRIVTHVGFLYDSVAFRLTVDALSHSGSASPGRMPFGKCLDVNLPGVTVAEATAATAVVVAAAGVRLVGGATAWVEPPLKAYAAG